MNTIDSTSPPSIVIGSLNVRAVQESRNYKNNKILETKIKKNLITNNGFDKRKKELINSKALFNPRI